MAAAWDKDWVASSLDNQDHRAPVVIYMGLMRGAREAVAWGGPGIPFLPLLPELEKAMPCRHLGVQEKPQVL